MRFRPEHIYYGTMMGDNCVPFIKELVKSNENSLNLLIEHYMEFSNDWEGLLLINGKPASIQEYGDAICTWSMHYELTKEYENEKNCMQSYDFSIMFYDCYFWCIGSFL